MLYGYHGKILHLDLTGATIEVEQPEVSFYRRYLGGSAMGAHYLLKKTPARADPLGPENTLCLMVGPITGAPISGQSRMVATAQSPLTGLSGESSAGGFWPAGLKLAGFDGVVIRGRSASPKYLWIHDGVAELRDAAALWGRPTSEVEDAVRAELGEPRVPVLQCGPAAERGVRFGGLVNNANRVNARSGLGAVMASKNLKAVVVQGNDRPPVADPAALMELAKWGAEHLNESDLVGLTYWGTAGGVVSQSKVGGLPTRNWQSGAFEGAEAISGQRMAKTIRKKRDTCFGCVVRCKSVVEVTEGSHTVESRYGGPEYESLAMLGSNCGISDLSAVARANQLCNMYGMDTISCGATIAWAMECFEKGLINSSDTGGVELRFGNAGAMVQMVEQIGRREGLGRVLGEGSARAAEILGIGRDLVLAVKGQELPAHMPQVKIGVALAYAVSPGGPDHTVFEGDPSYINYPDRMAELGLLDPPPVDVINSDKVRYVLYTQYLSGLVDSLSACNIAYGASWHLYGPRQLTDIVRAVTGWDVSLWELMKVGERRLNLQRAFNAREGVGAERDTVPPKLSVPLRGGASEGALVDARQVEQAKAMYYQMAGWDESGRPRRARLEELALGWVADELGL
jgi:aldehyde:ferredoxin oxidoreductase